MIQNLVRYQSRYFKLGNHLIWVFKKTLIVLLYKKIYILLLLLILFFDICK